MTPVFALGVGMIMLKPMNVAPRFYPAAAVPNAAD